MLIFRVSIQILSDCHKQSTDARYINWVHHPDMRLLSEPGAMVAPIIQTDTMKCVCCIEEVSGTPGSPMFRQASSAFPAPDSISASLLLHTTCLLTGAGAERVHEWVTSSMTGSACENSFLDWLGLHLRSFSQTIEQKPWKRGHEHGNEDVKENVCDTHI